MTPSVGAARVAIVDRFLALLGADEVFAPNENHPATPVLAAFDGAWKQGEMVYVDGVDGDTDGTEIRARPGNWDDRWSFDVWAVAAYPGQPATKCRDRVAEMVDAVTTLLAYNPMLRPTELDDAWISVGNVTVTRFRGPLVSPAVDTGFVAAAQLTLAVQSRVHSAH